MDPLVGPTGHAAQLERERQVEPDDRVGRGDHRVAELGLVVAVDHPAVWDAAPWPRRRGRGTLPLSAGTSPARGAARRARRRDTPRRAASSRANVVLPEPDVPLTLTRFNPARRRPSRCSRARSPRARAAGCRPRSQRSSPISWRGAGWARHEPPVQVFAAVAPAADVDSADVADRRRIARSVPCASRTPSSAAQHVEVSAELPEMRAVARA